MNWRQAFSCLDFYYNRFFYHHVHFQRAFQFESFVMDRQMDLRLKTQAKLGQFVAQALLVHRFQQARPKMTMNLNRRADNTVGKNILRRLGSRRYEYLRFLRYLGC